MKHTQTNEAYDQLLRLYAPLLEHIFSRPAICVQVCRNLKYTPPRGLLDGSEDFWALRSGRMYTWHLTL